MFKEEVRYGHGAHREKVQVLVEDQPHTLAEFVTYSARFRIHVKNLPEEINPSDAQAILGEMDDVLLKPLPHGGHYFSGWFALEGKKVLTSTGLHLFTIISTDLLTTGHRLVFEPVAVELLKNPQSRLEILRKAN